MKRALQFARWLTHTGLRRPSAPALRRKLFRAIVVGAALTCLLHAQSSAPTPATNPAAPATLPAAPLPAAPVSNPFAAPSALVPTLNPANSSFGRYQAPISFADGAAGSRQGGRSGLEPFQPNPSFENFAGSTGVAGRQSMGGFNQMGSSGMNGHQGSFGPLFPASDGPARDAGGPFGSAPAALPSLNQLMRGSFNMPFNSSSSIFRFTYQDTLRPSGTSGDFGRPNASAIFTTSDLGNGVFLSAGTGYGARSLAGAPPAGLGNGTAGAHKPSGPAVNLKLSF
jgi:hypothetical protein